MDKDNTSLANEQRLSSTGIAIIEYFADIEAAPLIAIYKRRSYYIQKLQDEFFKVDTDQERQAIEKRMKAAQEEVEAMERVLVAIEAQRDAYRQMHSQYVEETTRLEERVYDLSLYRDVNHPQFVQTCTQLAVMYLEEKGIEYIGIVPELIEKVKQTPQWAS